MDTSDGPWSMYTQSNENQVAWNFPTPELEIT